MLGVVEEPQTQGSITWICMEDWFMLLYLFRE